jgi:hypothetical protein
MDARKFDWIRKQLGLSKVESGDNSEYRVKVSTGASHMDRHDSLVWQSSGMVPKSHGGLLEERSEPAEEMTRKPKVRQGNRGAKGLNFLLCL